MVAVSHFRQNRSGTQGNQRETASKITNFSSSNRPCVCRAVHPVNQHYPTADRWARWACGVRTEYPLSLTRGIVGIYCTGPRAKTRKGELL